ncbi:hypothetical protein [Paenibacillus silvisoli]|uniref:hypothetical protein n=1 Tax=Paenibacillus silvisoli TaxID=3110539 RepID=UPI0028051A37|nr:hypothetical protein [Paenibacillus silvisoli]
MSKSFNEIAGEIVQEVIKARAQAIAASGSPKRELIADFLSDEVIAATYLAVFKAVNESIDIN